MLEANIQNSIRIALSPYGMVFRTNAGEFWQGKLVDLKDISHFGLKPTDKVLIKLRHVQGLPEGFSDLLFVGDHQVTFIETKNEVGRLRPEQKNFIERVRLLGHSAGVARCDADALELIK